MPRRFAITVGVNRYDFLPHQGLCYAERDAVRMRDLLTERLGFEKVLFFGDPLDGSGKRESLPTLANLLTALDRVAKQVRLQPADSFWFFFSGHGAREGGYDYLLPSDGNPDLLQRTAISTDSVMRGLRECGAGQVVMILDACRNVLGGGKSVGGVGRDTENLARQQGIISLFSCAPEQISWELEALEQGAFTQALLEKLGESRGLAGLTVQGLDEFLRQRVPELNRLHRKQSQNPYVIAEPSWRYLQPILPGLVEPKPEPEPDPNPVSDLRDLKAQASDAFHDGDLEWAERLYEQIVEIAEDPRDRKRALDAIRGILQRRAALGQGGVQAEPETVGTKAAQTPSSQSSVETIQSQALDAARRRLAYEESRSQELDLQKPLILQLRPTQGGAVVPLELLPIPGGTFWMGQTEAEMRQLKQEAGEEKYQKFFARELPRHRVTVPPFWMGRYPVTQAQYEAVMGNNPATQYKSKFVGPDQPVVGVTWNEAVAFCQKLTQLCREDLQGGEILLPTEAQWEYACRAGTETAFYLGDRLEPHQANFDGNYTYNGSKKGEYRQVTTLMGSFPANGWGLQDMHGNVWEWCRDEFYESYAEKPEALKQDGSIAWESYNSNVLDDDRASQNRVLRGGSWLDIPWFCRSAVRIHSSPGNRDSYNGFRLACSPR